MSIQYYRKAAANYYNTSFYYNADYQANKRFQTYLGRQILYEYNTNRILSRKYMTQVNYSGFPYVDMRFNRDNSGLITSITSDSGLKALTALYNNDLEIEQVQHTLPQNFDEGYTYDTRGNRLTSLTDSYSYNDLNQLTNTSAHIYTYDADGNMIEEKNNLTTETKKFYYTSENRMIKYKHYPTDIEPVDIITEYKYDIYGRRLQKNVNGVITNFFWEGDNMSFELNANYQPIRRYIYENGMDDVQGHVEYAEVDDPQYFSPEHKGWYSYIKDQVGTILKVYKHETKQMINTKTYDTFGRLISQTGSSSGNLGFQSKYYDQESGLNYYYNRYYYSNIGRFVSQDPVGISCDLNLYKFVRNNPIIANDPFGLFCIPWFSEKSEWYFDNYPNRIRKPTVDATAINPQGKVICTWTRTSFGYKERMVTPVKLCFEKICGKFKIYKKYGESRIEKKMDVYNYEIQITLGWGYSGEDITKLGRICCPNPWPPFDIRCDIVK